MTPFPSIIERAKQGDLEAITTLLQDLCHSDGIKVKVALNRTCLQILLEGPSIPNQTHPTLAVIDAVQQLHLRHLESIKVYGKSISNDLPTWDAEYPAISSPFGSSTQDEVKLPLQTSDFWQTLRTFQFSSVFPYSEVFQSGLYKSPIVQGLLFFGLFPVILRFLAQEADFSQIAWLLSIYYASFWGVFLFNLIAPIGFSLKKAFTCILFTAFVGIPMLLFVQQVPPFSILYAATDWGLIPKLFGFVFGVGVLEEICKALSLYFFLLRPKQLNNPLTAAIYGAMSGLGFAVAEGATYSLGYAASFINGGIGIKSYVLVNTIRFISLPLFHAVLAGIVGYFFGLAAINPARQWSIMFIGIAIAAVLHGLYNTFAGDPIGVVILAFTILLFVVYLRRSQHMIVEMQQAEERYRASREGGQ